MINNRRSNSNVFNFFVCVKANENVLLKLQAIIGNDDNTKEILEMLYSVGLGNPSDWKNIDTNDLQALQFTVHQIGEWEQHFHKFEKNEVA